MKKKILLFNYFLKVLAQFEQKLMSIDDVNVAMLTTITSHATVFRHYPSGCTMENVCACIPSYAQELFLYVLFDAKKNGDNLFDAFDFRVSVDSLIREAYRDDDLSNHLSRLFPIDENPDLSLFATILRGKYNEKEIKQIFNSPDNFRKFDETSFEIAEKCEETEMIDRALKRLWFNADFLKSLNVFYKHDHFAISNVYYLYKPFLNMLG